MTNIWINNVDDQRIDFYFAKYRKKKVLICSLLLDLISSKTVAPQKIWVDGPLSYSSIHKKNYVYFAPKYVWMEVLLHCQ